MALNRTFAVTVYRAAAVGAIALVPVSLVHFVALNKAGIPFEAFAIPVLCIVGLAAYIAAHGAKDLGTRLLTPVGGSASKTAYNPATGLPLVPGGNYDVAGNLNGYTRPGGEGFRD